MLITHILPRRANTDSGQGYEQIIEALFFFLRSETTEDERAMTESIGNIRQKRRRSDGVTQSTYLNPEE